MSLKNEKFQQNNLDIFLIFAQNIDCGYTLEPPCRGGSNEYPLSVICIPQFRYIKVVFKEVNITRTCFRNGDNQNTKVCFLVSDNVFFFADILQLFKSRLNTARHNLSVLFGTKFAAIKTKIISETHEIGVNIFPQK